MNKNGNPVDVHVCISRSDLPWLVALASMVTIQLLLSPSVEQYGFTELDDLAFDL